jgi:hypothetical protein
MNSRRFSAADVARWYRRRERLRGLRAAKAVAGAIAKRVKVEALSLERRANDERMMGNFLAACWAIARLRSVSRRRGDG